MKKVIWYLVPVFVALGLGMVVAPRLFSESEKILARIGDRVITERDFEQFVKMYEAQRRGAPLSLEGKKELLNRLVRVLVIATEAEKEKLDQKPEFQSKLKIYRNELLTQEYIATVIEPSIQVKDEEVNEVLKNNPNLVPDATFTLKEIVVKSEKEADQIYQVLKDGADFSKIATEKSISSTKARGGLLGTLPKGQLPPPVAAAVSELKEGEFTKPMKKEDGFQLLYLVNRKETTPEQRKMLEEKVRERIIQLEKNKKIEAAVGRKVEELKKQIHVETYSDQIN